jgi:uncharacterized membrane protein YkvA (DUF1232 family)
MAILIIANLRQRAKRIKADIYAIYIACRHPDVPWYVKALGFCVVAYAFSPIDLIPDFIPVLGYLDDLVLLPIGILLTIRLIPPTVLAECRQIASQQVSGNKPISWAAGIVIVAIWLALAAGGICLGVRLWF